MVVFPASDAPLRPAQLRRLQALWHGWTARLGLPREADRRLRHFYVWLFSGQRAQETRQLTGAEAARVIAWLERVSGAVSPTQRRAAGTAGREGYPERRRIRPNAAGWRALWGASRALGMSPQQLDAFIRRHYASAGLSSTRDLRSMADLNRVLWGLKAMLRRGPRPRKAARASEKKAA